MSPPVTYDQTVKAENGIADINLSVSDADGDVVFLYISGNPSNGKISGNTPLVRYTADVGFSGTDMFRFKGTDGMGESNEATVIVTVDVPRIPLNSPPVAYNIEVNGTIGERVDINLSASDVDGDSLTYTITSPLSHGSFIGTPPNFAFIPDDGFTGVSRFRFTVSDGINNSNEANGTINILRPGGANSLPHAIPQEITVSFVGELPITLEATDADGDSLVYMIVNAPLHGTLTGTPPHVAYTPDDGYKGEDFFSFVANDGAGNSNEANVSLTVGGGVEFSSSAQ